MFSQKDRAASSLVGARVRPFSVATVESALCVPLRGHTSSKKMWIHGNGEQATEDTGVMSGKSFIDTMHAATRQEYSVDRM